MQKSLSNLSSGSGKSRQMPSFYILDAGVSYKKLLNCNFKCNRCGEIIAKDQLRELKGECPACGAGSAASGEKFLLYPDL
jgi:ribosomal protein S27AE